MVTQKRKVGRPKKQVELESEKQLQAFRIYQQMGDSRSLEKVAKEVGVSLGTMHNWSKAHSWQERLIEIEAKAQERIKKKMITELVNLKERQIGIARTLIDDTIERIQVAQTTGEELPLQIRNVSDLEKVVKLLKLIEDDQSGQQGGTINIITSIPRPYGKDKKGNAVHKADDVEFTEVDSAD